MALTITEREHWKERIKLRIDKAITAVYCEKDPGLLKRIKDEAKRLAAAKLGLDELLAGRKRLLGEIGLLQTELAKASKLMVASLRGCSESEVYLPLYARTELPQEVDTAVNEAAASIEERLLAKDPLGKQVLTLRREKEELLDTVWIATSGRQIKELWTRISERLDQEPTPLQADALRIAPDQDDS